MPIEKITIALPEIVHDYQSIAAETGADPEFILNKVGLRTRHVLGPDQSGVSLSVDACRALLDDAPQLRDRIECLVCVTQTPDQRIPHNAGKIVSGLGLPAHVASFDISLGCSGYVYGLKIITGFMEACGFRNGILVTCDPYSRIMAAENKDTNCVFGDAASATWIRTDASRCRFLAADFGSDGDGGHAIEIPAGGALMPFVSLDRAEGASAYTRDQLRLHMRGRDVFNFVMTRIPDSMANCLKAAGLSHEDIDLYALHQGSKFMLDQLVKRAGINPDRVLFNMDRYGNTVSTSIPLLLKEAEADGKLENARVMISGFGVGLSWGSAILEFSRDG